MASYVSNLIEYSGLADQMPVLGDPACFKQFSLQETLKLPAAKPDIEQIVKIMAEVRIISTRCIHTPVGTSEEGQVLTGKKLIIEGEVIQKVEYVADVPSQAVHAAHFVIPFSTFIVLPPDFECGAPVPVTAYIEDIFAELIDKRTVFKNITILLVAEC